MCLACLGFMLVLVLLRIAGVPLGTPFSDPKYENKAQQGRKVWIAGTIETYEKKSSNNGYVLRGEGSKGKIYLLAKRGDLPVGAAVRVYGTVKKPESPRNPGMFDEKTYYEGKGCAFYVISEREEVVDVGRWNLGEALRLERERCCAVLKEMMPEEEAGVLSAMLLGERSELTEETYLAYQQSGLLHLISVSGMHLMLLGMALRRLLMALHLPKTPASLAAAAGMVLYGMFTGSGTATVRAVVMFAVRMGAVAVGRTYDSLSALSLTAILMLAENPSYLEQSGFWLSFGAVTAISGVYPVLAGEKAERKRRGEKTGLEKLAAKGKEAAMVYLSLQLVMIPLQAWYFYEIPLFAFLPNLFAGAVMTAVLLTGAAGLLAGLASVKAGSVVLLPARFLLTLLRQMTAAVAQIPGNVWINSAAAHLSGRCAPRLVCSYCSRKSTLCTRHKTTKNPCLRFGRMTERCRQKRPRREPWALNAENRLFKGDVTSAAILLGSHLPSAESTGVAAVAAAGLNAGPVLELDLVALCKGKVIACSTIDGDDEILCAITLGQIKSGGVDLDVGRASIIRFLAIVGDGKLKATVIHAERNLFGGTLDAQVEHSAAVSGGSRSGVHRSSGVAAGTIIHLEGAHQLQGAADFTGLLILILTTANEQAGTSHSHGSGGAVLQERAAVEF